MSRLSQSFQSFSYTMATALLSSDVLDRYSESTLTAKLAKFASLVDEKTPAPPVSAIEKSIARYRELSTEKTTDATRRKERQVEFIKAIDLL